MLSQINKFYPKQTTLIILFLPSSKCTHQKKKTLSGLATANQAIPLTPSWRSLILSISSNFEVINTFKSNCAHKSRIKSQTKNHFIYRFFIQSNFQNYGVHLKQLKRYSQANR